VSDIASDVIAAEMAALTPAQHVAPDALGYGTDLLCDHDIGRAAESVAGLSLLQQDIVHWIETPPGGLPGPSPDERSWGFGASTYLHAGLTQQELANLASRARAGLMTDDRIEAAQVDLAFSGSTLTMKLRITPAAEGGPFNLIVYVEADGSTQLEIT
jgi:hypothetical protein